MVNMAVLLFLFFLFAQVSTHEEPPKVEEVTLLPPAFAEAGQNFTARLLGNLIKQAKKGLATDAFKRQIELLQAFNPEQAAILEDFPVEKLAAQAIEEQSRQAKDLPTTGNVFLDILQKNGIPIQANIIGLEEALDPKKKEKQEHEAVIKLLSGMLKKLLKGFYPQYFDDAADAEPPPTGRVQLGNTPEQTGQFSENLPVIQNGQTQLSGQQIPFPGNQPILAQNQFPGNQPILAQNRFPGNQPILSQNQFQLPIVAEGQNRFFGKQPIAVQNQFTLPINNQGENRIPGNQPIFAQAQNQFPGHQPITLEQAQQFLGNQQANQRQNRLPGNLPISAHGQNRFPGNQPFITQRQNRFPGNLPIPVQNPLNGNLPVALEEAKQILFSHPNNRGQNQFSGNWPTQQRQNRFPINLPITQEQQKQLFGALPVPSFGNIPRQLTLNSGGEPFYRPRQPAQLSLPRRTLTNFGRSPGQPVISLGRPRQTVIKPGGSQQRPLVNLGRSPLQPVIITSGSQRQPVITPGRSPRQPIQFSNGPSQRIQFVNRLPDKFSATPLRRRPGRRIAVSNTGLIQASGRGLISNIELPQAPNPALLLDKAPVIRKVEETRRFTTLQLQKPKRISFPDSQRSQLIQESNKNVREKLLMPRHQSKKESEKQSDPPGLSIGVKKEKPITENRKNILLPRHSTSENSAQKLTVLSARPETAIRRQTASRQSSIEHLRRAALSRAGLIQGPIGVLGQRRNLKFSQNPVNIFSPQGRHTRLQLSTSKSETIPGVGGRVVLPSFDPFKSSFDGGLNTGGRIKTENVGELKLPNNWLAGNHLGGKFRTKSTRFSGGEGRFGIPVLQAPRVT